MITEFNENLPSSQCELNSLIQETDKETEEGKRETN